MFETEEFKETEALELTQETTVDYMDLIIYNDDVNTFDFVIESLIKICDHSSVQAEQCTWIIHHNGKCSVKRGELEKLKPMAEAFLNLGISAKIEP